MSGTGFYRHETSGISINDIDGLTTAAQNQCILRHQQGFTKIADRYGGAAQHPGFNNPLSVFAQIILLSINALEAWYFVIAFEFHLDIR